MKDYITYDVLDYFRSKLTSLFAMAKHTHKKSDVADLKDASIVATDDNKGNVTIVCSSD